LDVAVDSEAVVATSSGGRHWRSGHSLSQKYQFETPPADRWESAQDAPSSALETRQVFETVPARSQGCGEAGMERLCPHAHKALGRPLASSPGSSWRVQRRESKPQMHFRRKRRVPLPHRPAGSPDVYLGGHVRRVRVLGPSTDAVMLAEQEARPPLPHRRVDGAERHPCRLTPA